MKNNLWKLLAAMVVLTILVPALAGCGAPEPTATPVPTEVAEPVVKATDTPLPAEPTAMPEAKPEEVVLRISLWSEPPTLDPNLTQDVYSINSIEGMFLGLTNLNNTTGEIEPELATDWEISDDGLVWTFRMRQDATWTDGKPVTAHDIEYSVKRAVMPETASPYAYVLYIIKNAKAINQTQVPTDTYQIDTLGVKALDDYTVQFTLEAPASYFLAISSLWTLRPVPQWTIEQYGMPGRIPKTSSLMALTC